MDSLDSIWDEPVVNDGPPLTPKESLFLDGSDDDHDSAASASAQAHTQKATVDIDMDALFAGVDDDGDDDAFTFKPLAPSLDTEALRREAEARYKNRLPSLTPHAVLPSSSPPRDTGNGAGTIMKDRGDEKGKERRKPVRLDEGRLLGPTGFPQLVKDTKNFRTKGKGHEATDLNRLLQVYQFWTHGLYPKTQFRDTVERIEKLCHSKRMNVSLSVWRDEAHGRVNTNRDFEDDEVIDLTEHEANSDGPSGASARDHSAPKSDEANYTSSSSLPPSRPPSSALEPDDDEDFDLDAIFRAEDERRAKEILTKDGRVGVGNDRHGDGAEEKGEASASMVDDDTMWDELDALESAPKHVPPTSGNTGIDDDQVLWDELDQIQGAGVPDSVAQNRPLADRNMEDDEMWDVINELESTTPATIAVTATTSVSDPPAPIPDDYDIEDMYM